MIDSQHHVQLGLHKFRIAERYDGLGYNRRGEPLRPPNSAIVQGSNRQDLFQVRPDVMLWSLTDWSGGEGQTKFNAQLPARHALLHNVDPFTRPGKVTPGPAMLETSTAAGVLAAPLVLTVSSAGELWGFPRHHGAVDSGKAWKWNASTELWVEQTMTGFEASTGVQGDAVDTDSPRIFVGNANSKIYSVSGGTATQMRADVSTSQVKGMHNELYCITPGTYNSRRVLQASAYTDTNILTLTSRSFNSDRSNEYTAVKGGNRIYVIGVGKEGDTIVRMITPFTPASAAADVEIARFPGFQATAVWWHNGLIHMVGHRIGPQLNERPFFYIDPEDLTLGTFGLIRPRLEEDFDGRPKGSNRGVGASTSLFTVSGHGGHPRVFELDTITGGVAQLSSLVGVVHEVGDAVRFVKDIFTSTYQTASAFRTYRMKQGLYTTDPSYVLSPWHDFGLADEKIISSISVNCEPLPANWGIKISYVRNDGPAFVLVGTVNTAGFTGERLIVSDADAPVLFRTIRIKAEFVWSGTGTPTTAPVLNSIEVRAQVAHLVNVWQLELDLTDDLAGKQESWDGSEKVNFLLGLNVGSVIELKDGYRNRESGQFTTHDVIVDSYDVKLGRAGEGIGTVTLREVA